MAMVTVRIYDFGHIWAVCICVCVARQKETRRRRRTAKRGTCKMRKVKRRIMCNTKLEKEQAINNNLCTKPYRISVYESRNTYIPAFHLVGHFRFYMQGVFRTARVDCTVRYLFQPNNTQKQQMEGAREKKKIAPSKEYRRNLKSFTQLKILQIDEREANAMIPLSDNHFKSIMVYDGF